VSGRTTTLVRNPTLLAALIAGCLSGAGARKRSSEVVIMNRAIRTLTACFGGFVIAVGCSEPSETDTMTIPSSANTTAASTSGESGTGGAGGGGGQGGGGGLGCMVPDKDMDGAASVACMGDDCDDADPMVHVGQMEFFEVPRADGSYDYNCNGTEDQEFETAQCSGVVCTAVTGVFLEGPVACGQMGMFGDCTGLCQKQNAMTKVMRCR
jgi:hypothetical protein